MSSIKSRTHVPYLIHALPWLHIKSAFRLISLTYFALFSHFAHVLYSFLRHLHVSSKEKWTSPVSCLCLSTVSRYTGGKTPSLCKSDILDQEILFMEYLTKSDPLWSTTLDNWPHPTIETPYSELQREIDRLNPEICSTLRSHGFPGSLENAAILISQGFDPRNPHPVPTLLKSFSACTWKTPTTLVKICLN